MRKNTEKVGNKRIRKTILISPKHNDLINKMAAKTRRVDIIEIAVEKLYEEYM